MGIGMGQIRTSEIEEEVLSRMSLGEPLAQICREIGLSYKVWRHWCVADPELEKRHQQARDEGYDAIALDTLRIADDKAEDYISTDKGTSGNSTAVARAKLQVETRLKLLAKWDPRRYGDKIAIGGADDLPPIKTMTDKQLQDRIAQLAAQLNPPAADE